MKRMKFVTGLLLALALISFASPMKAFAAEKERDQKEVQAILPDSLSEEDEKAINAMIFAYQRSRSASPEQLEGKISNYFVEQYGTARSIYVVEFKSQGNGSIAGRLVYVLMGNDAVKYLNQASGGFVVPEATSKAEYAFSHWKLNGVMVESEDLATYQISGSSIFYAEFMPDSNGDGIPDHKQRKFNIQFLEDSVNGRVEGDPLNLEVYEPINGEVCYIYEAVGYREPAAIASPGYAFDYWLANGEKIVVHLNEYEVNTNLVISAIFAVDSNYDGIPDHRQTLYNVDFMTASGGNIPGETHYMVPGKENDLGESVGYLREMYPWIGAGFKMTAPDVGYMLEYWIDQNGDMFYPISKNNDLWDGFWSYAVKCDTVFVAVFAEDINCDNIPDYKQMLFHVNFMGTSGGSLSGMTHYIVPGYDDPMHGSVGKMREAFPVFDIGELKIVPDDGYTLDYWIDHRGNQYYDDEGMSFIFQHFIKGDTVFVAVFAEDGNGDGVPDYREPISD